MNLKIPDFSMIYNMRIDSPSRLMILLKRPESEFVARLVTGVPVRKRFGTKSTNITRLLKEIRWQSDIEETVDQLNANSQRQTESFEIDWDVLQTIAESCGLTLDETKTKTNTVKDGHCSIEVPLPLLMFNRFVLTQQDYVTVNDAVGKAKITHREYNEQFAAFMLTYVYYHRVTFKPDCNTIYSMFSNFLDTFRASGSDEIDREHAVKILTDAHKQWRYQWHYDFADDPDSSIILLYLSQRYVDNYPTLLRIRPSAGTCRVKVSLYRFGYKRRAKYYGAPDSAWSKVLAFCANRIQAQPIRYRITWLRDSAHATIKVPDNCMAAPCYTPYISEDNCGFFNNILWYTIHRKPIHESIQHRSITDYHHFNAAPDNSNFSNKTAGIEYAQDFKAIIVPRSRRVWPLLAQWLMQAIVWFMVAHIWKLWPLQGKVSNDMELPMSAVLSLTLGLLGATALWAESGEEGFITQILEPFRKRLRYHLVLFDAPILILMLMHIDKANIELFNTSIRICLLQIFNIANMGYLAGMGVLWFLPYWILEQHMKRHDFHLDLRMTSWRPWHNWPWLNKNHI